MHLSSRSFGPLAGRGALPVYGMIICASVLVTHSLTYVIIGSGLGYEANPFAGATIWMPAWLNLAVWEGALVGILTFLLRKFEANRTAVLITIVPVMVFFVADAVNDVVVACRLGLL